MNSVSWFIYIAQVSGSLGAMFIAFGVLTAIGVGAYCIFGTLAVSVEKEQFLPQCPRARFFALAFVLVLVGNLMPAQNTMYAIAASEVGGKIAASETARGIADDATKALQQWIKRQIEPGTKK